MTGYNFKRLDASDPKAVKEIESGRGSSRNRTVMPAEFVDLFWNGLDPVDGKAVLRVSTRPDLKLKRQVFGTAAWMKFHVGPDDNLQCVSMMVGRKQNDLNPSAVLSILKNYTDVTKLPALPLIVIVCFVSLDTQPEWMKEAIREAVDGFFLGGN